MIAYKCKTIAEIEYVYVNYCDDVNFLPSYKTKMKSYEYIFIKIDKNQYHSWCNYTCSECIRVSCEGRTENIVDVNNLMREEKLKRILE
jgi:regulatory protein YycH of two-component signal transduction system YycFG